MKYFLLAILFIPIISWAQPNCNVYLYNGDTLQYEACRMSEYGTKFYQFKREAMENLDSCIQHCPRYAYAHYEKAVVYLKAGNFVMWDEFIDNAVKLEPKEYLGNRASCRAKFFADYQGAIDDIDTLTKITNYDIGHIHDGSYHLDAYKALCYKSLGNHEKAIEVFEEHMKVHSDDIGFFDYIHLGVAYIKTGNHEKALDCFRKQSEINNLAENNFYAAMCHKALDNPEDYKKHLNIAHKLYLKRQSMLDGYHTMEDEIFLSQIEEELEKSFQKN